jgi:hypothetical protein
MNFRRRLFCALILGSSTAAFVACGGDDDTTTPPAGDAGTDGGSKLDATTDATTSDAARTDAAGDSSTSTGDAGDAASDAADGGGEITLQFDPSGIGSPDAIYWDNTKKILYIVDDENNQVWTWTDAAGFVKYATVPDNPALDDAGRTKLNGVTELADGTLVVTRFGYGTGGAIYTIPADGGAPTTVPNVDGGGRRIEVTSDPTTGVIYSDSFMNGAGGQAGEIETVNLDSGITVYASGFAKTVGLLVQNGAVLVADQTNNVIVAVPTDPTQIAASGKTLTDGGAFPVYANVIGPDQLSAGPNGTIYTDEFLSNYEGGSPQVRQIFADGGVVIPFPTAQFTSLSDVAYDPSGSRLFVADTNGTTVRTIKILPVAH